MLAAWLLAAVAGLGAPQDDGYRQALHLLYDGSTDGALARFAELRREQPADPMGAALEALALAWKLEQRPHLDTLDRELQARVERAVALADTALLREPGSSRALLARGAAHGVGSRYHLFRLHRREAARAAVRMREDLLALRERAPENHDLLFGLGLYDYYADVLPRFVKIMRFFLGIPGGDRERGLRSIEAAKEGSLFYGSEVRAQLYDIHAWFEGRPDLALAEAEWLREHYPHSPLWALRLSEHLRDRLGLYARSAAVSREILEAARKGQVNYSGEGVRVLARVHLGEALLLDGRPAEARAALLPVREGTSEAPALAGRARWLLGRSLELEGDREAALVHYRRAVAVGDRETRRRAQAALDKPLGAKEVQAWQLVVEARRDHEAGRAEEAAEGFRAALRLQPDSQEAALRVAEDELGHGRIGPARQFLAQVPDEGPVDPPWVRPWRRLLEARTLDLAGERQRAVELYRNVLEEPYGQPEVRHEAEAGLRRPFAPSSGVRPRKSNHIK